MEDDEIALWNVCADLLSLKAMEPFPRVLLTETRPGEWVRVRDICRATGLNADDAKENLFATWLADPMAHEAYAVVQFYDDESKWSTTAEYNRSRFYETGLPHRDQPFNGSASPGLPHSVPQGTEPATER